MNKRHFTLLVQSVAGLVRQIARTSPRATAVGMVLLLGLTITEGAGLLLLAPLLALVGVVEDNPLPRAADWVERAYGRLGLEPTLESVLVLFVALAAMRAFLARWQAMLNARVREELTLAHRMRLYGAMARAEWRFLAARHLSSFVHVLTNEAWRVGAAAGQLSDLAVTLVIACLYLAMAIRLSPPMAMLVLVCGALLAWFVSGSLARARSAGARSAENRSRLYAVIAEHVGGIKTAKSYGLTERHEAVVQDVSESSRERSLEVADAEARLQQTLEVGSTFLLALVVFASAEFLHVPSPLLLVLIFIFARLIPRLVTAYRLVQGLALAAPVLESMARLEQECEAAAVPAAAGSRDVALTRELRFEDVTFAYQSRGDARAVEGLTFAIPAGMTTAIVGSSGSGKTTAADLLVGLLAPTSGSIRVDGQPLGADTLASWRGQIGYVPQDTFLFRGTVRDNLRWVRPEASDEEIWDVLKLAALDGMVAALPDGLDTPVGERGLMLSGGERQRLAIARALLRRPRVLVLDEATSSLDSENEQRIQQAIDRLHHRMTIVVITHRLSTVRDADVIHVMEGGRIVESGTWDTLQANPASRFRELSGA